MKALHYAAAGNHMKVMQLLIDKGADENCTDKVMLNLYVHVFLFMLCNARLVHTMYIN